jgi:hypothetical protein
LTIHSVHIRLDAGLRAWFASAMKVLSVVLLFVLGLVAQAAAGGYKLENRPEVVFKGGIVHQTPYPQSKRAASVWASDACWRDCKATCTWKMEYCVGSNNADACRPHLDACDRSCQRSCRGLSAGPLLGFFDF